MTGRERGREKCQGSRERKTLSDTSGDQGETTGSQNWMVILGSLKQQFNNVIGQEPWFEWDGQRGRGNVKV